MSKMDPTSELSLLRKDLEEARKTIATLRSQLLKAGIAPLGGISVSLDAVVGVSLNKGSRDGSPHSHSSRTSSATTGRSVLPSSLAVAVSEAELAEFATSIGRSPAHSSSASDAGGVEGAEIVAGDVLVPRVGGSAGLVSPPGGQRSREHGQSASDDAQSGAGGYDIDLRSLQAAMPRTNSNGSSSTSIVSSLESKPASTPTPGATQHAGAGDGGGPGSPTAAGAPSSASSVAATATSSAGSGFPLTGPGYSYGHGPIITGPMHGGGRGNNHNGGYGSTSSRFGGGGGYNGGGGMPMPGGGGGGRYGGGHSQHHHNNPGPFGHGPAGGNGGGYGSHSSGYADRGGGHFGGPAGPQSGYAAGGGGGGPPGPMGGPGFGAGASMNGGARPLLHPEDREKDMNAMRCRYCGEFGHMMRYCARVVCFTCHAQGHMASVCPTMGMGPLPPQQGAAPASNPGPSQHQQHQHGGPGGNNNGNVNNNSGMGFGGLGMSNGNGNGIAAPPSLPGLGGPFGGGMMMGGGGMGY